MALYENPLMSQTSEAAQVRMKPDTVGRAQLPTGSGTYLAGTPFGYLSGAWVLWDGDAANESAEIYGFLYEETTLDGTDNVIAPMMTAGEIHYDDVWTAVQHPATDLGTEGELQAAIEATQFRQLNLRIAGYSANQES